MDPLVLGALVALITVLVLFSGVSVAIGLLIVSAGFLIVFDGARSLELMPEIFFGKLDNFALLSIPMFIIMGASIASTRAGADLYEALERWLTRIPGGLVVSNLGAGALFAAMSGSSPSIRHHDCVRHSHRNINWSFVSCRCVSRAYAGNALYGVVVVLHLAFRQQSFAAKPKLHLA